MADEGNKPGGEGGTPHATPATLASGGTVGGGSQQGDVGAEERVPRSRLNEVLEQKRAVEARLAELEAKQKAAEEAALAEQGKFKELYEAAAAKAAEAAERAQAAEAALARRTETVLKDLKARVRELPQEFQDIMGEVTPENLDEKLDLYHRVAKAAGVPPKRGTGPLPAPGNGGGSKKETEGRREQIALVRRAF